MSPHVFGKARVPDDTDIIAWINGTKTGYEVDVPYNHILIASAQTILRDITDCTLVPVSSTGCHTYRTAHLILFGMRVGPCHVEYRPLKL